MDVDSRIPQITQQLQRLTIPQAVEDTAEAIVAGAKDRAPVDSGELRNSITQELEATSDGEHDNRVVKAEAWYAHFVENGTTRQSPRPFLAPAAEAERDNFAKRVTTALKKSVT